MCVIVVCTSKVPPLHALEAASRWNPHGAGYAYPHGRGVAYYRGTGREAVERVLGFASEPRFPCLIHFRLATVGGTSPHLAHPFPVPLTSDRYGVAEAVVATNGHHGGWVDELVRRAVECRKTPPQGEEWSDSKALAWVLSTVLRRDRTRWLAKNARRWGRVAYLTAEGVRTYGGGWNVFRGYMTSSHLLPLWALPCPDCGESGWRCVCVLKEVGRACTE